MLHLIIISFLFGLALKIVLKKKSAFIKKTINKYLIYIGFPLFLFVLLQDARDMDVSTIFLYTFVSYCIILFLSFIIIKKLHTGKKTKASIFLAGTFGNIGFIGIPIILLFFDDPTAAVGSLVIVAINLIFFSLGIFLSNALVHNPKKAMFEFLKFPGFYTTILAFFLSRFNILLPDLIVEISHFSIYIALFIVGISFDMSRFSKKSIPDIAAASILKFILVPLIWICGAYILKLDAELIKALMVMGTVPTAIASTSFSVRYDFDDAFVATFTSFTTIIYLIIIAILALF